MSKGIIYYNRGTSCAVRLLTSTFTLRRFYDGPVTILSEEDESHKLCELIAPAVNAEVKEIDLGLKGKNAAYLTKTLLHKVAPYDVNLFIDADTLIIGSLDELFGMIEKHSFMATHMAGWSTTQRVVARRIKNWADYYPDLIEPALNYGKAINTGVYGFTPDSALMRDWYDMAIVGRKQFIPDETCCQLMVPKYSHTVADHRFNVSCKYDNPNAPDMRVVHYHGRKHCRVGLPFHGEKWVKTFSEVNYLNIANVSSWMPAGDKMLAEYLRHLGMDF